MLIPEKNRRKFFPACAVATAMALILFGCATDGISLRSLKCLSRTERAAAVEGLREQFDQTPEDWEAFYLGELAADEGDYAAMLEWFDRSLELSDRFGDGIDYRRALAWKTCAAEADSAFLARDIVAARGLYEIALGIETDNDQTRLRLLECRVLLDGPDAETIRRLREADSIGAVYRWLDREMTHRTPAGDRIYADLAASVSKDADLAFVVAELARQRMDYRTMARACDLVTEAGHEQSRPVEVSRDILSRKFLEAANQACLSGRYELALACLDTVDLVRPGLDPSAAARPVLQSLISQEGRADVSRLESSTEEQRRWLGVLLAKFHEQGRLQEAEQVANTILSGAAEDSSALLVLSHGRDEAGDRVAALSSLDTLLKSGYTGPSAAFNAGVLCLETSRNDEAAEYFRLAAETDSDRAAALLQLAILAFGNGDFSAMKDSARRLVQEDGAGADSWRLLLIAAEMSEDDSLADACRRRLEAVQ